MTADSGKQTLLWYRLGVVTIVAAAIAAVLIFKQPQTAAPAEADPYARLIAEDNRTLPMLLDLGAGSCVPCKLMMPILKELQEDCGEGLRVRYIDVKKNPEASKLYNIQTIPTQIFLNAENKELFRHEGFFAKEEILEKWREFDVNLQAEAEVETEAESVSPESVIPEPAPGQC